MNSVFNAGSKVPTACDTCRKRKRKCNGDTPTCLWCAAKGLECRYTMERPKRTRPSAAHVEDLEAEIDVLKQQVGSLQGSVNLQVQSALMADNPLEQWLSSSISSEATRSTPFDDFSNPGAAQDISSLMWRLKIDDKGNTSFIGPSGNFCLTSKSIVTSTRPTSSLSPLIPGLEESANDTPDLPTEHDIIAQMEGELLLLFEHFINPMHQFLDQETVRLLRIEPDTPQLRFLRLSTLSAAAILSDNANHRRYGQLLFANAEAMALSSCRDQPTVSSTQALCLLGWRELGLENENMAWMYISMACSMTLHLGLSVSSLGPLDEEGAQDPDQQLLPSHSIRAQTFWAVLFQERIATSLLGRHPLIPSTRVRAKGFLSTLNRPPTLQETVFDLHCELWFIHDKFMDKIYSFEFSSLRIFDQMKLLLQARQDLAEFKQRLNLIASRPDESDLILYCRMSFHMSQLLIHRPFLHEKAQPNEDEEATDSEVYTIKNKSKRLAAQTSYQAAAGMARLIRTAIRLRGPITVSKAPFFVVHSILTAAVTLLMFSTSQNSQIRSQATSRFRTCFGAIHIASHTWPRAVKGIAMLRELAERWSVVSALPLQYGVQPGYEERDKIVSSQQDSSPASMPDTTNHTQGPATAPSSSVPTSTVQAATDMAKGYFNPWLFSLDEPPMVLEASSTTTGIGEDTATTGIGSFDPSLFSDLNLDLEMDYDKFISYEPYNEEEIPEAFE